MPFQTDRRCVCQDADPNSLLPPGADGCTPRTRRSQTQVVPLTATEVRAAIADDHSTRASLREIARAEVTWRTAIRRVGIPAALSAAPHSPLAEFVFIAHKEA